MRRALAAAFERYNRALSSRPILTKSLTAAGIAAAGDVACQQLSKEKGAEHDYKRTGRMVAYTFAFTPLVHFWYGALTRNLSSPLRRMAVDQLVFAPFGVAAFFLSMSALEHHTLDSRQLQECFWPVLQVNWMAWPAIQLANFTFVAPPYQVLTVNVASFFWSMYISKMANSKKGDPVDSRVEVAASEALKQQAEGGHEARLSVQREVRDGSSLSSTEGQHMVGRRDRIVRVLAAEARVEQASGFSGVPRY